MLAFHNDPSVKEKYLVRVRQHAAADEIVKGQYWEEGKGCAVGCTLHGSDHAAYETELGIPQWLARLEDTLFEGLPDEDAKHWPERFLSAIRPGADLEKVRTPFLVLVMEALLGKFEHEKFPSVVKSVKAVLAELQRNRSEEAVPRVTIEARNAAWSASPDMVRMLTPLVKPDRTVLPSMVAREAALAGVREDRVESQYKKFTDQLLQLLKSA